jgi:hypothetical protein
MGKKSPERATWPGTCFLSDIVIVAETISEPTQPVSHKGGHCAEVVEMDFDYVRIY